MPVGTSEGEQHADDFSFHFVDLEKMSRVPVPSMSSDSDYNNRFQDLPNSRNIDDRRNEIGVTSLAQSWLGILPEEIVDAFKTPLTPFQRMGIPPGANKNSVLAKDAGLDSIGDSDSLERIYDKLSKMPEDKVYQFSDSKREVGYKDWLNDQSKKLGRDLFLDTHSYDLEGYFNKYGSKDLTGEHLTDEFKRPSHITFSNESAHHGTPEKSDSTSSKESAAPKLHEGGQWEKLQDGSWTFTPGRTNLKEHTTQELIDYFKKYEPDNHLLLPGS